MSTVADSAGAVACAAEPARGATLEAFPARKTALGGLPIRRLLPRSGRRLVGPWCFFDAYGPEIFATGKPMDVAPHPHIGLQTVSWLLEGEVLHHDSLGSTATARPGALNLMTAGRGIAHAEETPPAEEKPGWEGATSPDSGRLFGVQLWVALPEAQRHREPIFDHYPSLPELACEGGSARVFLGGLGSVRSSARAFSPVVGAELATPQTAAGARLRAPLEPGFEHALMVLKGKASLDGRELEADTLYYLGTGRRELSLSTPPRGARLLLIGGAPFEETVLMWWNFVARTTDEIVTARDDWEAGRRFGEVRAYAGDRIPAPPFVARPVPTPR